MVHTRNQPGGDLSPATSGRPTTTTGSLVPATSYSTVTSGFTAAGDSVTTGSNTATGGLLSSRPGGTLAVTSPPSSNVHFSASVTATPRTRLTSSDVGTNVFGQMALRSAYANPVSFHDWDPLITGPGHVLWNRRLLWPYRLGNYVATAIAIQLSGRIWQRVQWVCSFPGQGYL